MAVIESKQVPGVADFRAAGDNVLVRIEMRTPEDALGMPCGPPQFMTVTLRRPVGTDGDLPLLRLLVATTTPEWKSKADQEDKWSKLRIVLDTADGFNISYDGTRLLIDGWRLAPSSDGQGYEEVLVVRQSRANRKRKDEGEKSIRLDGKPKK